MQHVTESSGTHTTGVDEAFRDPDSPAGVPLALVLVLENPPTPAPAPVPVPAGDTGEPALLLLVLLSDLELGLLMDSMPATVPLAAPRNSPAAVLLRNVSTACAAHFA
jgi:hypothetical protein